MGICPCINVVFLHASLKQDKKANVVVIEDLDKSEDKVLNNAKELVNAQRMINTTFQRLGNKYSSNHSLHSMDQQFPNNIVINNIIIIPQYKRNHSEHESENSCSSLPVKGRPIYAKLLSKKSQ